MTYEGDNKYRKATTLDDAQLKEIVQYHRTTFSGVREEIEKKRQHFHNLPIADPVINKPYDNCQKFQSDAPRRLHVKMSKRLTENKAVIAAKSTKQTQPMMKVSNDLSAVCNTGWEFVQDRQNVDLQSLLASYLTIEKYGILHWCRADDIWPPVPEAEYLDELPTEGAERYEKDKSDVLVDEKGKHYETTKEGVKATLAKKHKETDKSRYDRMIRDQAQAGFPYWIEAVPPATVWFTEDRSLASGFAIFGRDRKVPRPAYLDRLRVERASEEYQESANQMNPNVKVYGQKEVLDWGIDQQFGETVTITEVWFRDEVYEICEGNGKWEVVKSDKHLWGMPPFAMAPAIVTGSGDPVTNYECALEGVYRVKALFDRAMTLFFLLAEMNALPVYYYEETTTGLPQLGEDGEIQKLSRDSALAAKVPSGYTLKELRAEVGAAFVQSLEFLKQEYREAFPATGEAETTPTTDAWAIRLQQTQNNVEPAGYIDNIRNAIQICWRSIVKDMSLKPEDGGLRAPVAVFARTKGGEVDYENVITVDPEDIKSLDVQVDIDKTSAAERSTLIQIGVQLLNDPLVPLTMRNFLLDFMGDANPDETIAAYDAEQLFKEFIKPGIQRQELARELGTKVVMAPDGAMVGMGGEPVSPQQVLQMNGQQPTPQSMNGMPALPTLQAPNTLPVGGRA